MHYSSHKNIVKEIINFNYDTFKKMISMVEHNCTDVLKRFEPNFYGLKIVVY